MQMERENMNLEEFIMDQKRWQGKVDEKLENISFSIKEMKNDVKSQVKTCNLRFKDIEEENKKQSISIGKLLTVAGAIAAVASILGAAIMRFLFR